MGNPTKRYDICAGRPYTTRAGETKKQWIKVGKLTEWDEGGPSIELFATPTGSWFDGKLACFEQEANGQRPQQQGARQSSTDPFTDEEIPFG